MLEKIKETTSFIKSKIPFEPTAGIILGTGLGGLVKEIDIKVSLNYDEIPNFPVSTVEGHSGKLIFGILGGKKVVAMQGRFHYYEGYTPQQVTFPVRVMKLLGVKHLFVSNASGGVNPDFEIGELMIVNDHINLIPSPLIGKNQSEFGPRFPDMSKPYSKELIEKALEIGKKNNIRLKTGVYCGVTGPALETPAEYVYFRNIGADTIGMSTVPEVIVARHMGIPCFAISIITDLGVPGKIIEVSHEIIQQVAERQEPKMTLVIKELVASL
jgi:purine-nucleoside phosphorylase